MTSVLAKQARGASSELTSEFLHELRTPLNQIIGYTELVAEQAQDEGITSLLPDLLRIQAASADLLAMLSRTSPAHGPSSAPLSSHEEIAMEPELVETEPGSAGTGEEQQVAAQGTVPGLILVVDDNAMNRDMLSRRLERQGYEVAEAVDGREAMAAVRGRQFDLVLLDIMMPEMDGYEVLAQLKADEALRHIPVIMISALDELDSVVRCIELGAEDYLPKPFNPTLLRARIGASLEKKRSHDREALLFQQLQESFKRLQDLEKLRDNLMHMIVHDLRSPLASLLGGIQMVDKMGELNAQQQEMIAIAIRGGNKLLAMINDLLDVDKIESGAMQLEYTSFQAVDLIAGAVSQVSWLVEGKKLELGTEVAAGLPLVQGDEEKLRRVLVNLLGNAVKFTPAGGWITIDARLSEDAAWIDFSVRDSGEGIPPEAFERIFEKFGQVEGREGGRKMSTGLGLAFCKLATEAHGGHITVESIPGAGSNFTFAIPVKRQP